MQFKNITQKKHIPFHDIYFGRLASFRVPIQVTRIYFVKLVLGFMVNTTVYGNGKKAIV